MYSQSGDCSLPAVPPNAGVLVPNPDEPNVGVEAPPKAGVLGAPKPEEPKTGLAPKALPPPPKAFPPPPNDVAPNAGEDCAAPNNGVDWPPNAGAGDC